MKPAQEAVVGFYETHPINEDEILARLRARGMDPDAITEDDLSEFDQDHYGGVQAVEAIARAARVKAGDSVLDVCSGMGGPARWLAWRFGCRVTGLDITPSRVEGAKNLTARVRLAHLADFVEGDATAMPCADAAFDAAISQEALCHIPDRSRALSECARVVRSGGMFAFTDIMTIGTLLQTDADRLAKGMAMPRPATPGEYAAMLARAGFEMLSEVDLSAQWADILVGRLEMYRSLRDTTVAKFGQARFEEYDAAYAHFVSLFVGGQLGGYRIAARRP